MIAIAVVRIREPIHVLLLRTAITILEILALGGLARFATVSALVRARVRDLVRVAPFHLGAPALVIAVERS